MKANYNVTGAARKALVSAISNITGDKAIYKLMPTCAYEIGDITVSKEGYVSCEDVDKLDRLMHNAHRIKLKGESMRKTLTTVDAT